MKKVLVIIGLIVAAVTTATAQTHGVGIIQGRIVDESDAVVPGVTVTATLEGNKLTGTSDEKGDWKIVGMVRGQWEVSFTKPGFAPSKAKVILESEQTRLWPITIKMKAAH